MIRLNHGGVWRARSMYTSEISSSMEFAGGEISPPSKVYKRFTDGPEENVHEYYKWLMMTARERGVI